MRNWVALQPKANEVDYAALLKGARQSVGEAFCALCKFARARVRRLSSSDGVCQVCPLDPGKYNLCCPEYHKVKDQIIWGGWVVAADKMIARLERELEAALAYQETKKAKRAKKS
jgi:hypothetical protein